EAAPQRRAQTGAERRGRAVGAPAEQFLARPGADAGERRQEDHEECEEGTREELGRRRQGEEEQEGGAKWDEEEPGEGGEEREVGEGQAPGVVEDLAGGARPGEEGTVGRHVGPRGSGGQPALEQ